MKKQLRKSQLWLLTLLAMLLGGVNSAWADELTIFESASSTSYEIPIYAYNADSNGDRSEFVVPSSMLSSMSGCTVTGMVFYCANFSWGTKIPQYNIYIKEVESATLTAYAGEEGATTVYTGELSVDGNLMTITFSTPYEYNGSNLLIGTKVTTSGSYVAKNNSTFYGSTSSDVTCSRYSGGSRYFIPKTTFIYEESGAIAKPSGFTCSSTTYNSAVFSWTAGGDETAWQIVYDINSDFDKDAATPVEVATNPYTLTGLTPETTYYAYLRAKNGTDVSNWTSQLSFTTLEQFAKPTAFTCTNVTEATATLSWTAGGEETAWQLAYSTDENFDKDAAEKITVNTTSSYTLTGLDDNKTYYVAVRAYFGETEHSGWTTTSFKTLLGPITVFPWNEDFNGLSSGIPEGWDNSEGTTTTNSYKWTSYSSGHEGNCVRFNSYTNGDGLTNFLKTRIMNLPTGANMQLKFWYKNPAGGDFSVYISNDGGATYSTELATGLTGVSSWTEKAIDIPAEFTDNVVIVFKGTSNWGSGDAYIYLDDVTVEEKQNGANFAINIASGAMQDFGTVKGNTVAEKSYTITNNGNADLVVNVTNADDFTVQKTIRFSNSKGWGSVYLHAWNDEGDLDGGWPGIQQTNVIGQNEFNQDIYAIEIPAGTTKIIMHNNSGWQSNNINMDYTKLGLYIDDNNNGVFFDDGYFNVPAGGSTDIKVVMNTTTWGDKSGNIELAFDALNANSFTIPCTGVVKDPNLLSVDFDDPNAFPEGWQVGADWKVYNFGSNRYAYQDNTKTASALVTTPLAVEENQVLTFKVKRNQYGSSSYTKSLKVRYSTDGGVTWSGYETYTDNIGASFSTVELTGIPVGMVIVEFFGNNFQLDDITGLTCTTAPALALTENGTAVVNNDTKDFGNLSAAGELTYTLKNIGNETLVTTVKGEGVTINNSDSDIEIQLPAGDEIDLIVRMAYGEPYGERTGMKMTIDSENEWIGDFVVNFTANLVDPSDFVIDFENGKPAGWYFDTWNVSDGVAHIYTGVEKPMITEMVGSEEGKNTLTFDAKAYYGDDAQTLKVYTSTDRMDWTLVKTCTLGATMQTYTQTLDNGEYYVKFEAANASVDNIKGVKKLEAPEHDLYLVEATLPTDEITPIDIYTATLKVASLRADEDVTAELWFDNDMIGEAAMLIPNGETKTFTVEGPAIAGEHAVFVRLSANGIVLETDRVLVNVVDKTELTITDFAVANNHVQADANNEFTAEFTVTVKNTGSTTLDPSVTITDEGGYEYVTATTGEALDAGETATINVPVTVPAGDGGEFNFKVREDISGAFWYANGLDFITVMVTAAPAIVLNETDGIVEEGTNRKVRLNHTFAAGWNTIFLPFATTPDEIATGAKALEFTDYNSTTNELTFSPANELKANTPYAIYVENAITEPIEFTGKTVTASGPIGIEYGDVTFQGIYAPMAAGTVENWYGLTAAGKIAKASATASLKGFRAYFTGIPAGATVRFFDNVSTGISTITVDNNMEGVYNLQGQKVEQLRKGGLYIINGKKTVVK